MESRGNFILVNPNINLSLFCPVAFCPPLFFPSALSDKVTFGGGGGVYVWYYNSVCNLGKHWLCDTTYEERKIPLQVLRDVSDVAPEKLGRQLLQKETAFAPVHYSPDGIPRILFWASNLSVTINKTLFDLTNLTFGPSAVVDVQESKWNFSTAE